MNRRLLIALTVVLPVALFAVARVAASWRPVAVGAMDKDFSPGGFFAQPYVSATSREVCVHLSGFSPTVFELQTAEKRPLFGGVTRENNALWDLEETGARQTLKLHFARQTLKFDVPKHLKFAAKMQDRANIRVSSDVQSVQMIAGLWYCRWDKNSGALQQEFRIVKSQRYYPFGQIFFSTDQKYIVAAATQGQISLVSRQSGQVARRVSPAGLNAKYFVAQQSSPRGNYLWYREPPQANFPQDRLTMIDVSTGNLSYRLGRNQNGLILFIFSPDETLFGIGRSNASTWEIRDTHSGQILRTLPLVPNTQSGAFSPDGATLYSVAGGVLYRQRAR